ncbi:sodium-dependent bicarbonate transport family permease [Massilia sp. H6]|uniref:sodium-dependent bicarbonate transport family permease n=1 Tax=Massilia sp. H6 TaxID=2970464 RepID=UPI002167DCD2|nr:sodium-dependent bicarbonate transport family permease [Massilia sp. H6]UVW29230.1 sodium-dependent bicarbonate transport family permease [Massilia sp. H6]
MHSFLDPAILFFAFGILAGCVKSNLEIPQPIARFLSLYLLMALGLKGGFALAQSGFTTEIAASLGAAVLLAIVVPMIAWQVLKRLVPPFDAAAVAATYGSVSAVTFITATQYLDVQGIAYGGHMAAAMALMESPAIVIAVVLANTLRQSAGAPVVLASGNTLALAGPAAGTGTGTGTGLGKILHESFTDGTQLLLLGAMAVGLLTGEAGKEAMAPFSIDLFKGMLAFFLLDMGLLTARNLGKLRGQSRWLLAYAVGAPVVHAGLAMALALLLGLTAGNAALLMVLASSASYIAVPAVLRHAIPEANPAVYFSMSLGMTFPLNILLGIPAYTWVAGAVLG